MCSCLVWAHGCFYAPCALLPSCYLIIIFFGCPTCPPSLPACLLSIFIFLLFSVLCQFIINITLLCPVLPVPVLPCPAKPSYWPCFPLRDSFWLNKSPYWTLHLSPHPFPSRTLTQWFPTMFLAPNTTHFACLHNQTHLIYLIGLLVETPPMFEIASYTLSHCSLH